MNTFLSGGSYCYIGNILFNYCWLFVQVNFLSSSQIGSLENILPIFAGYAVDLSIPPRVPGRALSSLLPKEGRMGEPMGCSMRGLRGGKVSGVEKIAYCRVCAISVTFLGVCGEVEFLFPLSKTQD